MNTDLLKKAKRLRFTSEDDLLLIRQVRGVNPYFNHERWGDIQESVCEQTGKRFSIRCIKEHVENLINSWIKKERIDKAKSGIEEIQTEMDFLLQEVADLMKEAKLKKETKGKKRSSFQVAKEVRDMWAATSLNTAIELEYPNDQDSHTLPSDHDATEMVLIEIEEGNAAYEQQSLDASSAITDGSLLNQGEENNDHPVRTPQKRKIDGIPHKSRTTSTPVHSRVLGPRQQKQHKKNPKVEAALSYLEDKAKKNDEWKERELALEESKVEVERIKLNLAEREITLKEKQWAQCEKRFEMEMTERKQFLHLVENQQKLFSIILDRENASK